MNLKARQLKALRPDYVFRNAKGEERVFPAKMTLGELTWFGARVQLTGSEDPMPPDAFVFTGERRSS